ncbi:MAG: type II secretion system protein [Verrucomicrobiia bacterium]
MRLNRRSKKGFTLTELLVLVAVGAILTGTLLASLSEDRQKMLQAACASNLKQWGIVIQLYADDFYGTIPVGGWYRSTPGVGGAYLWGAYRKYCGDRRGGQGNLSLPEQQRIWKMKMCPAQPAQIIATANNNTPPGYSMVRADPPTPSFRAWCQKNCKHPASMVLMIDSNGSQGCPALGAICGSPGYTDVLSVTNRHFGGANVLWADQHLTWEPWDAIQTGFTSQNWGSLCALPPGPMDPNEAQNYCGPFDATSCQ